jgi:hypothetical protein
MVQPAKTWLRNYDFVTLVGRAGGDLWPLASMMTTRNAMGYIDFLSATMRNVPSRLPFQDGAQIGAAIMHQHRLAPLMLILWPQQGWLDRLETHYCGRHCRC